MKLKNLKTIKSKSIVVLSKVKNKGLKKMCQFLIDCSSAILGYFNLGREWLVDKIDEFKDRKNKIKLYNKYYYTYKLDGEEENVKDEDIYELDISEFGIK